MMPTDFVDNKYAEQLQSGTITQEDLDRFKELYGLSDNSFKGIVEGYFGWLGNLAKGDLGISFKYDGKLCLPGDGIINPSELTAILDKIGYSGHVSLEWEKRWQPELAEPDEAFARYVEWMPLSSPFNLD